MYSDRLWLLKLALTLGLFLTVCRSAHLEFSEISPFPEVVALAPPEVLGKTVFLYARKVRAQTSDGFVVEDNLGPYRVLSSTRPEPGEAVSVRASILGPRLLRAEAWQLNEGHFWKRKLNYGISVLTVLVVLWMFRGLFRVRLREGLFRSRY